MGQIDPLTDDPTEFKPNETVRLTRHKSTYRGATPTPDIVDAEVSSTAKTISIPGGDGAYATSGRLNSDEMDDLLENDRVYRTDDNISYQLYHPVRYADHCENLNERHPRSRAPANLDPTDLDRPTHLPTVGRFKPDDPVNGTTTAGGTDTDTGTQTATDGGRDTDDADGYDADDLRPEWFLKENGGVETDSKAWVAQITGGHPKYGADREFLTNKDGDRRYATFDTLTRPNGVQIGDVLEIAHNDVCDERRYAIITDMDDADKTFELQDLADADTAADRADMPRRKRLQDPAEQELSDRIESKLADADKDQLADIADTLDIDVADAEADADDESDDIGTKRPDPTIAPDKFPGESDDINTAAGRLAQLRKNFKTTTKEHTGRAPTADERAALIDAFGVLVKQLQQN